MDWLPTERHADDSGAPPIVGREAVRAWLEGHYDVNVAGQLAHYAPKGAVLFYGGPFSNFVGGPFYIESRQPWSEEPITLPYATVESFFQASKAQNLELHHAIGRKNPGEAKGVGNVIALRPDWDSEDGRVKYDLMLAGLRAKFADPFFRDQLLGTGERYIAEDSPTDYIWGIRDKDWGWSGRNLLGLALMQIRDEIRS